jgi:shikimate kinase
MTVVLVGMPGVGKSTVARQLAHSLGVPLWDSDSVIERRLGTSIREYFASQGEVAFRDLEQRVLDELMDGAPGVLATGGGVVLRAANRRCLHERGTVIYLRAAPEFLFRRLRHDTRRPLLQVADPLARLKELYAERDPLYRESAHFVMDVLRSSRGLLIHRILMQLELMPDKGSGVSAPYPDIREDVAS